MRSLINILDLSVQELDELIAIANDIIANPGKYSEICRGKKLASMPKTPTVRLFMSSRPLRSSRTVFSTAEAALWSAR